MFLHVSTIAKSKMNETLDAEIQTENSDQTQEIQRQLDEITNKYIFLSKASEQKDDMIKLLIREKNILDGEKVLVRVLQTKYVP